MAKITETEGCGSGTGQDTHVSCPVPLPRYALRDMAGHCPGSVPLSRIGYSGADFPRHSLGWLLLCLRLANQHGRLHEGRRSRSKGARTERSIVHALLANGIAAVRVPLSGAVGGSLCRGYCLVADGA